jgi:hypothetical protein
MHKWGTVLVRKPEARDAIHQCVSLLFPRGEGNEINERYGIKKAFKVGFVFILSGG